MFPPKSILVPTDFSPYSDKALQTAIDLAKQFKSKIYLLHVIDEGLQQCVDMYCLSDQVMKEIEKQGRISSNQHLEQELSRFPGAKDSEISFDIKKGHPSEEIIKDQKEKAIDLIVISSHGRSGILKNLLGGTVNKVLRNAGCPVLLLKS